ncbi:MAG: GxxExxY protein [Planctomycetes bacterium]|nr:GxxExxY protein [Planctomycetota bacterium]
MDIDAQRLNSLTERVIGMCIDVHKETGPGLLESVYEECLCVLLAENGLGFVRQGEIPVRFRGRNVGHGFRYDLLVEGQLLIELKSVEKTLPIHKAQVLTYLRLIPVPLGLLVNFNSERLVQGITRLIHPATAPRFLASGPSGAQCEGTP